MVTINLLPPELAPKEKTVKVAKLVKRILIAGFAVYVVGVVAVIASIFLLDRKLKVELKEQEDLKASILALQETEQRLLLTQDRVSYADQILSSEDTNELVDIVTGVLRGDYTGIDIASVEVLPATVSIIFSSEDADNMENFVDFLVDSGNYKNININGFRYSSVNKLYETNLIVAI